VTNQAQDDAPADDCHSMLVLPQANFHEKAHFVKADVADPFVVERYDSVSFAMLPSAVNTL
jgi:hypothetical protein